jgi:hypothetical protein
VQHDSAPSIPADVDLADHIDPAVPGGLYSDFCANFISATGPYKAAKRLKLSCRFRNKLPSAVNAGSGQLAAGAEDTARVLWAEVLEPRGAVATLSLSKFSIATSS